MSRKPPTTPSRHDNAASETGRASRAAKQAEALRANLRRRKAQARARAEGGDTGVASAAAAEPGALPADTDGAGQATTRYPGLDRGHGRNDHGEGNS